VFLYHVKEHGVRAKSIFSSRFDGDNETLDMICDILYGGRT